MKHVGRISFICSGNICRSPMAEVFCKALLESMDFTADVSSAGTLGIEDQPAATNAVRATWMLGIDLTAHRSQGIDSDYLGEQDALVVMSEDHAQTIRLREPSAFNRIHRLWEFTDETARLEKIYDPVGGNIEQFIECRDDIVECTRNWIERFAAERL